MPDEPQLPQTPAPAPALPAAPSGDPGHIGTEPLIKSPGGREISTKVQGDPGPIRTQRITEGQRGPGRRG